MAKLYASQPSISALNKLCQILINWSPRINQPFCVWRFCCVDTSETKLATTVPTSGQLAKDRRPLQIDSACVTLPIVAVFRQMANTEWLHEISNQVDTWASCWQQTQTDRYDPTVDVFTSHSEASVGRKTFQTTAPYYGLRYYGIPIRYRRQNTRHKWIFLPFLCTHWRTSRHLGPACWRVWLAHLHRANLIRKATFRHTPTN